MIDEIVYVGRPGSKVKITMAQLVKIHEIQNDHPGAHWHLNECGCCVTVHVDDRHDRGYVVGSDGEAEWIGSVD